MIRCVLQCCTTIWFIVAATVAGSQKESTTALEKSRGKITVALQDQAQPQDVLQIVETEVYRDSEWVGATNRWSNLKGKLSEPPSSILPPPGYQFEGDWKIVTSSSRDSLGWEYIWSEKEAAIRRRLWLRTIVATPIQPSKSVVAALKEHWNFKGFGMSLYKSLIFAKSIGVAFQLPILYNLDWWERHPALPSLSTSVACYFPWMTAYLISGSLNVDFVAWVLGRSFWYLLFGVSSLMLALCRLFFLPLAVLLYPIRGGIILPDFPLPTIPKSPPVYSLTISQRLGMSVSWRVSEARGYEFRVSYWYQYMPTILHLYEMFHRNKQLSRKKLTNWLRRKVGSVGISAGAPLPVPPHYFCTACLSLSGFYLRKSKTSSVTSSSVKTSSKPVDDVTKPKSLPTAENGSVPSKKPRITTTTR